VTAAPAIERYLLLAWRSATQVSAPHAAAAAAAAGDRWDRQTDGRTRVAEPLRSPFFAYCANSVNNWIET